MNSKTTHPIKLIINALSHLQDKEAIKLIAFFLDSKDIDIQLTAINALGMLKADEYEEVIKDKFNDEFSGVRLAANKAIKQINTEDKQNNPTNKTLENKQNSNEFISEIRFEEFSPDFLSEFKKFPIHNRFEILKKLAYLKKKASIPPLRDILLSKEKISQEVQSTLYKIAVFHKCPIPFDE